MRGRFGSQDDLPERVKELLLTVEMTSALRSRSSRPGDCAMVKGLRGTGGKKVVQET